MRHVRQHLIPMFVLMATLFTTIPAVAQKGGGGANTNFAVVFSSDGAIALTTIDDGNRVTLTRPGGRASDLYPVYSHRGDQIAFVRQNYSGSNDREIRVIAADGTGERLVFSTTFDGMENWLGTTLRWTPNDQEIVFGDQINRVWAVNVATREPRVLFDLSDLDGSLFSGSGVSPDISPARGQIAFDVTGGIYVDEFGSEQIDYSLGGIYVLNYDFDESGAFVVDPQSLTPFVPVWSHPVFSPDGTRIAYSAGGFGPIWVLDLLTGVEKTMLDDYAGELSWSPDGLELTYSDNVPNRRGFWYGIDLLRLNVDGEPVPIPITNTSSKSEFTPSWNPNWVRP